MQQPSTSEQETKSSEQETKSSEQTQAVHFGYIDGLRGLAAVYVMLHHFCLWGTNGLPHWTRVVFGWTAFGHFAVAVFITLPGFCLMLPVSRSLDKTLRGGFGYYIKRRAWRILPPYYAALALALLVTAVSPQGFAWLKNGHHADNNWLSNFTVGDILSHIMLAQNLSRDWTGRLDMPMWSIATEWQIYFVFGLVLMPVWRRFGSAATIAVSFILGILPHLLLPAGRNLDWACPWYLGLFSLGMISAVIAEANSLSQRRVAGLPWLTLFFGAAYLSTKMINHGQTPGGDDPLEWLKDTFAGIVAASVILYCALQAKNGRTSFVTRFLQSRVAVGVGTWSYSLYLVHCLVLQEMQSVQQGFHLSSLAALYVRVFIGLPLALTAAYLFFLIFEAPFLRRRDSGGIKSTLLSPSAELAQAAAVSPAP